MKNIFFRREGQIAPFMIAIIVVLIMALMVTVNIGKVGITKTNTANASDAGALAGSTTHANTLNALADTNTAMIAEYLAMQVMFLLPFTICIGWARYVAYLAFVAAQITQFILAWLDATKGYDEAEKLAKQLAFMNAGIDEPKSRLDGESYEAYLQRDSRFGQWMKDEGYESGYYSWTNKQGRENSVRVDVDAPSFPGLLPMPMILIGIYMDFIGPCIPPHCMPCIANVITYIDCFASAEIPPAFLVGVTPIACPSVVFTFFAYPVPVAWIAMIIKDNPEITVTTTRVEPNANLGIWEMRYGNISSQAKARSSGGSVGPIPDPGYDSCLISGGY